MCHIEHDVGVNLFVERSVEESAGLFLEEIWLEIIMPSEHDSASMKERVSSLGESYDVSLGTINENSGARHTDRVMPNLLLVLLWHTHLLSGAALVTGMFAMPRPAVTFTR